jgi:formate dehydrogenase major subunit
MASGREAGVSASRYLSGDALLWGRSINNYGYMLEYEADLTRAGSPSNVQLNRTPVAERDLTTEIEKALNSHDAKQEAERCITCGRALELNQVCWFCLPCEIECPVNALEVRLPYLVK